MLVWNATVTNVRVTRARVGTGALARSVGRSQAARFTPFARIVAKLALLFILFAPPSAHADDCISIHDAHQRLGETECVGGKVIRADHQDPHFDLLSI